MPNGIGIAPNRDVEMMKASFSVLFLVCTIFLLERNLYLVSIESLPYIQVTGGIRINVRDMLAFLALFIVTANSFKQKRIISPGLKYFLIYLVCSIVFLSLLSLLSGISLGDFGTRLRRYFYYIFIPAVILQIVDKKTLKKFLNIIVIFGLLTCCLHFYENIFHKRVVAIRETNKTMLDKDIKTTSSIFGSKRVFSRSTNTTLAAFVISSSLLLLYGTSLKMFHGAVVAFTGLSTFISMNRTNMLFLIIYFATIMFMSIIRKGSKWPLKFLTIFCSIAIVGSIGAFFFKDQNLYNASCKRLLTTNIIVNDGWTRQKTNTLEDRKEQITKMWNHAINSKFPLSPVFGIGIKTSSLWTADVGFINPLLDMGVLGVILLIWAFIYLFYRGFKIFKLTTDPYYLAIAYGFVAGLFSMVITSFSRDWFSGVSFTYLLITIVVFESINKLVNHEDQV